MNSLRIKGLKPSIALFAWRVTRNYAYNLFNYYLVTLKKWPLRLTKSSFQTTLKCVYRLQGESKKKCDLRRLVQNCTPLCNSPVWCIFNIILLKIWNLFGTPMAQKKIRKPFLLSKSKVQKSKNVYINYFYRNLKFFKDCITENSQNCNKKIRNF